MHLSLSKWLGSTNESASAMNSPFLLPSYRFLKEKGKKVHQTHVLAEVIPMR
jgi:hypothetical protein